MKKFFRRLLLILILLIIVICSILFIIGFSTYSKALKEKPLIKRVSDITSQEHFVKYDDLPKNYINAVVATEDHRYYDHGPVDFIGVFRAIYTNIRNGELQEGGKKHHFQENWQKYLEHMNLRKIIVKMKFLNYM